MNNNHINLTKDSWLTWPETRRLVEVFDAAGKEMRFVGGAVRDLLAGVPVKDVDVANSRLAEQVLGLLEKAGIKAIPTGLSHGTVTAVVEGKPFEITTLRCDIKTFGRHAEVLFTRDWEQDAARRDFTINALYCDAEGRIYDYHHGLEDLRARRVRFIGNPATRIREDGLRILRFFRFTARYGEGEVDTEGLAACHECRDMLDKLSGERIAQEMFKLLETEAAPAMIRLMDEQRLTLPLFGYAVDAKLLECWARVGLMVELEEHQELPIPMVLLSLLCRAQEGAMADYLIKRWKLSNAQSDFLRFLDGAAQIGTEMNEAEQKRLLRRYAPERFRALVLVSWAENLAANPSKTQMLSAAYRPMVWLAGHWSIPEFPVSGGDLAALGLSQGPQMGAWLKQLEDWWERENYQPTREEILERFQSQR